MFLGLNLWKWHPHHKHPHHKLVRRRRCGVFVQSGVSLWRTEERRQLLLLLSVEFSVIGRCVGRSGVLRLAPTPPSQVCVSNILRKALLH